MCCLFLRFYGLHAQEDGFQGKTTWLAFHYALDQKAFLFHHLSDIRHFDTASYRSKRFVLLVEVLASWCCLNWRPDGRRVAHHATIPHHMVHIADD